MGNVIKLEIDTDDSYTTEEKENLLEAFLEFIQGEDPSVVEGTESIRIVSSDADSNGDVSDEAKQEIIKEFLDNAKFTARLNVEGDGIGMEHTLTLS